MTKTMANRTIRSEEEKRKLVSEYDARNENVSSYCRRHGLADTTFHKWLKKYRQVSQIAACAPPNDSNSSSEQFINISSLYERTENVAEATPTPCGQELQPLCAGVRGFSGESQYAKLTLGRNITIELSWARE